MVESVIIPVTRIVISPCKQVEIAEQFAQAPVGRAGTVDGRLTFGNFGRECG